MGKPEAIVLTICEFSKSNFFYNLKFIGSVTALWPAMKLNATGLPAQSLLCLYCHWFNRIGMSDTLPVNI